MLSTISKITKKNKMLKKSRKHIIIKRKKHNFQPHTTLTFLTFITLSRIQLASAIGTIVCCLSHR